MFINWIKTHKLIVLLLVIIAYFIFKDNLPIRFLTTPSPYANRSFEGLPSAGFTGESIIPKTSISQNLPDNRVVIQESSMSLLVGDVQKTSDQILSYVKNNGGYMVNSSLTRPTESPFASITIRIPSIRLDDSLSYFRNLAVKVTSENLVGTDVTEQYIDIQARLATLKKTQIKFEDILEKATNVQDILTVQRELINLQDQIDNLKGQQQAIEKNAELSKITIYLSTDELALPYTPDKAFRPAVVFKYAVRSLLNTLRIGAEVFIWIAVYSPLILIAILIFISYKRIKQKRSEDSSSP